MGIKAAPGIARDAVPPGWETGVRRGRPGAQGSRAWSPALARSATRATILPGGHTLTPQPGPPVLVAPPGPFLLDPNPAVTRAGLVAELARSCGGWQIDAQIAFLCTGQPVRTPFARTLQVLDSGPWHQRELVARLRELDIGSVDIRRRGLAGDVSRIQRQLKLSGPRRATLIMTRAAGPPLGPHQPGRAGTGWCGKHARTARPAVPARLAQVIDLRAARQDPDRYRTALARRARPATSTPCSRPTSGGGS